MVNLELLLVWLGGSDCFDRARPREQISVSGGYSLHACFLAIVTVLGGCRSCLTRSSHSAPPFLVRPTPKSSFPSRLSTTTQAMGSLQW